MSDKFKQRITNALISRFVNDGQSSVITMKTLLQKCSEIVKSCILGLELEEETDDFWNITVSQMHY